MKITIKVWQLTLLILLPILYFGAHIIYAATSGNLGASLTIQNQAPSINFIEYGVSATPTEATTTDVTIEMHVTDPDGEDNINDSKVNMTLYKPAETNRTDSLCTPSATGTTANMQNFTCTMDMQYFDGNGSWTIYGYASDINGYSVMNATQTMTYNTLEAWNYTPSSITFGSNLNIGNTNTLATDDPVIFYNRGNYNLTSRMQIKGLDLKGTTNSSYIIPAANFSVNVADGCDSGNTFTNNTDVNITSFSLPKGVTLEQIYFCLEEVPAAGITAQGYSATGDGAWNLNSD